MLFSIRTELSYSKIFFWKFIIHRNENKNKKRKNIVYLGLSILEISAITTHYFWYDYDKPKSEEKAKLCYMDTGSLIVYIKTEEIYKDITKGVETRFDTSNYE